MPGNKPQSVISEHSNRRQINRKRIALGVSDDLAEVKYLSPSHLISLGLNGIKTLDDLADLSSEELIEVLGSGSIDRPTADTIIIEARAHWYTD